MTTGAIVLRLRYGIGTGEEHPLADGARELGMWRQRICRIEAQALEHLRSRPRRPRAQELAGTA
jgi:RNA polymerase primary sigma factor